MRITKKFYIGAASLLVAAGAFVGLLSLTGMSAEAMTITDRRDCGYTDPIIDCGATSTEELLRVYDRNDDGRGNKDVQAIFNHYGVTRSAITDTSNIKKGWLNHTTGTISVDGKVVGMNAQSLYRVKVSGKTLSPVSINGKTYYIGSVAGQYSKGADVFVFYKNGKAYTAIQASCGNPIPFTPKEEPKPEPKPVYACERLTADKISRLEYKFVATASAENATVKSYTFNFGDGTSKVITTSALTASTTHAYADKEATYVASVMVTMSDGKTAPIVENCKVTVKIDKKPVEAKPSIDIVKTVNGKEHVKVAVGTEFTYEITVRNTGNVVLKNAVVTDTAPSEVTLLTSSAGTITGNVWKHTIPELNIGESKSFTIKAKYAKYAGGTHKNRVCVETPTVPGNPDDCDDATTETKELIEVCDLNNNTIITIEKSEFDESHMTTDLSKCGDIKVCIIEDKVIKVIAKNEYNESTMTTDMSKCEEIPEVPVELPKTGIDTLIGGGLGIGSITAAGYYWSASRRNLLSTLLNR